MNKRLLIGLAMLAATTVMAERFPVDDFVDALPFPLSEKAKTAFVARVQAKNVSLEQAQALLWQLMSEGEMLLSKKDQNELFSFYQKAVETLTLEEQRFVAKVTVKVGQGRGYSESDQQKNAALVQKGFSNLPSKENARFLELRGKALSLALLKPSEAHAAFESFDHPFDKPIVRTMTFEEKALRVVELTQEILSFLPENERARYIKLQSIPSEQLTREEYSELLKYTELLTERVPKAAWDELGELAIELEEKELDDQTLPQAMHGMGKHIEDVIRHDVNTPEADEKRLDFLHKKAMSLVPESEKERLFYLCSKDVNQLSEEEYMERVQATQGALARLPPQEMKEFMEISMRLINRP